MTSKNYYFKVLKENLKRFWGIGFFYLAFVVITDLLRLMLAEANGRGFSPYFIRSVLDNETFGIMMYNLMAPILIAVILFRYIQQSHSSAVCHGWPMTRRDLFIGNALSGWLILIVPLLVRGVIVWLYKEPTFNFGFPDLDIYTGGAILEMTLVSIAICSLAYAIVLLATMLTGSSLFQSVFSLVFLFMFPAFGVIINEYFSNFLFGFESYISRTEIFSYLTPYPQFFDSIKVTPGLAVAYMVAAILLTLLAAWLYRIRPLERASDPIAIQAMEPVFKLGAAFVGMSILGFYIRSLINGNEVLEVIGFMAGAVIALMIAEMIVQKTFWFVRNFRSYLVFTGITLLFLITLKADVFGYETRIPALDQVERVTVLENGYYYTSDESQMDTFMEQRSLSDSDTIEKVLAFHQDIVTNQAGIEKPDEGETVRVIFLYRLASGKTQTRVYSLPWALLPDMNGYRELVEDDQYRMIQDDATLLPAESYESLELEFEMYVEDSVVKDRQEKISLMDAIREDLKAESFEEYYGPNLTVARLIAFQPHNLEGPYLMDERIEIKAHFTHTLSWLEAHGYGESLAIDPIAVDHVQIRPLQDDESVKETMAIKDTLKERPESSDTLLVIDDFEQIQTLLNGSYRYGDVPYNTHTYDILFVFEDGQTLGRVLYEEEVPGFVDKYFVK